MREFQKFQQIILGNLKQKTCLNFIKLFAKIVEKLLNYIRVNYLELVFAGFFFVLINASKLAGPYILLMVLVIIINYVRKTIAFQLNKFSLLFAMLYCAYAIGIIWTENMDQASKYLENKAVFILFPFLFSFRK